MPTRPRHDKSEALDDRIQQNAEAREALRKLSAHPGIDEGKLMSLIEHVELALEPGWGFERWSDRTPLSKAQARRLSKRLQKTALEVHDLFTPAYNWYLTVENKKCLWLQLVQRHLLLTSALIDNMLLQSDDRTDKNTVLPRRILTEYILDATRRPHDAEVSALIAVALKSDEYTAEDQRKFRSNYKVLKPE